MHREWIKELKLFKLEKTTLETNINSKSAVHNHEHYFINYCLLINYNYLKE